MARKAVVITDLTVLLTSHEWCILCEAINCPNVGFDAITTVSCKSSYTVTRSGYGFSRCKPVYCWADGNNYGIINIVSVSVVNCIFSNCNNGVRGSDNYRTAIINSIAYNCTNSGFENRSSVSTTNYINCISYENGAYGWDFNLLSGCGLFNCASGNNTSGRTDGNETFDINAITLTEDPFVDAANGNFSLNNAAGGGALCRQLGIGIPGQTPKPSVGAMEFVPAGSLIYFKTV